MKPNNSIRTVLNFILIAQCIILLSCKKDDIENLGTPSISLSGVLSGNIADYSLGLIDSVKLDSYNMTGKSVVSSDGNFSIIINNPEIYKIGTVSELEVSDTNAMMAWTATLYAYKNEIETGELTKCNYTSLEDQYYEGMAYSLYWYSDRVITIKGPMEYQDSTFTSTTNYDITLKRGWNELVMNNDLYSVTNNDTTMAASLTNKITADLKWHYFKYESTVSLKSGQDYLVNKASLYKHDLPGIKIGN